ncbi:hypothetical protein ANCDUO_18725 [Ancylostoma duodenale]|uniref:Tryptophan 2,3-dioxygenase n=1 Tax=Ancylostoma duodenale TaxID=51022 RepID=A0A0C2G2A6_9BILA|nr:hypothetical protein ANCDUO_18725 [Ancylostoma duodenale]
MGVRPDRRIKNWLERTPGLKQATVDGEVEEGFWPRYERAVRRYLGDLYEEAMVIRFSHIFLSAAVRCVYRGFSLFSRLHYFRDMPRFSQPYQILTYLMDIDSLFTKWRYNHVILVQRMLGSKQGTGGSSGYMYLRSTVSDKYKVFLDLFNLSTWLIPREYIPSLSARMVKTLSEHSNLNSSIMSSESE